MSGIKRNLIAHRGASAQAPENTLAAMSKASSLGMQWVEFDVQLTKDHHCIVMHDNDVRRTTDGQGLVAELSLGELKRLDAGSWFSSEFSGESIPTFAEMLVRLKQLALAAHIELKPVAHSEDLLVEKVLQVLSENTLSDYVFSSFSLTCLQALRARSDIIPLGYAIGAWSGDVLDVAKELDCRSIHMHHTVVTPEIIHSIMSQNIQCHVFTVNDELLIDQFLQQGVNAVFTDVPAY